MCLVKVSCVSVFFLLAVTLLSFSSYLFLSLLGHFTVPHLNLIQGHRWQKDLLGIRSEDDNFLPQSTFLSSPAQLRPKLKAADVDGSSPKS